MEPEKLMAQYVAFLRALYHIHQNAHWKSQGDNFYGNHLLFQRLYEGTSESVDMAAEKTLGVFDELEDMPDFINGIVAKFDFDKFDGDIVKAVLAAEEMFQKFSKSIYDKLKELSVMTLGLDDMLMELAGKHEVHIYLLKQAGKF